MVDTRIYFDDNTNKRTEVLAKKALKLNPKTHTQTFQKNYC